MEGGKFRLITRADFDGVAAGALLLDRGMIDEVLFAEPKDVQDGRVPVTPGDITTNLPYVYGVNLCFDHHVSETVRVGPSDYHIIDPDAPSAARVVYDYFGGEMGFPKISPRLMEAVDRADTAQFTEAEILDPKRWTLLSFILDPRTGLDRFDDFSVPQSKLMIEMMEVCRRTPIPQILELPDIAERVARYREHQDLARGQLEGATVMDGKVALADLRTANLVYCCNRFLIYAVFPDAKVSVHLFRATHPGRILVAAGKSIFDRSATINLGLLMLEYGGGGHAAAATCQVDEADAEDTIAEIVERINNAP